MAHDFTKAPKAQPPTSPPSPVGRAPTLAGAVANVLPHGRNTMFLYKEHPMRWHCVDGEWLPQLGTLKLDLGANGVDKRGNIEEAVMMAEKRNWRIIPLEVMEGTYVSEYDCNGGLYFCSRWETPQYVGDKVLSPKIDEAGYKDFLRMLVRDGHVRPPNPDVLEQVHLDRQAKMVQNLAKQSHKPGVEPDLKTAKIKYKAMEKGIAAIRAEASP